MAGSKLGSRPDAVQSDLAPHGDALRCAIRWLPHDFQIDGVGLLEAQTFVLRIFKDDTTLTLLDRTEVRRGPSIVELDQTDPPRILAHRVETKLPCRFN